MSPPTAGTGNEPRRLRLTSSAREQQLLDVAEELFTERGFEGVSIEELAQAAGVSRPIVYQHYGSKAGIFLACVERARLTFQRSLVEATDESQELEDQIDAGGRVFFDLIAAHPRRWALLFTASASLGGEFAHQLGQFRYATVAAIAERARQHAPNLADTDLFAFAYAVSGVGEQLGRWWLRHPHVSRDHAVRHYRTMVTGLARAMLAADATQADRPR